MAFQDLLASLRERDSSPMPALRADPEPEPDRITVRAGDCLSRICAERLKALGSTVSRQTVAAAVQEVARANRIADPDRIRAGQPLDLSSLGGSASGRDTPGALTRQERLERGRSLVEGALVLSSGFGLRKDPLTGRTRHHDGIDVAAPAGSPILACAAGSVVFSGWKPGYGNTVILRHEDGLESVYGHASKVLVQVGDQVEINKPIGRVGSTGRSTGAHLHFEVRDNGRAVNPATLLDRISLEAARKTLASFDGPPAL